MSRAALVIGNSSGSSRSLASGLLLGRVHVSLQSAPLQFAWSFEGAAIAIVDHDDAGIDKDTIFVTLAVADRPLFAHLNVKNAAGGSSDAVLAIAVTTCSQ